MEADGTKKRIKGYEERKGKEKTMQQMRGKQYANKAMQGYVPNQRHLQMQSVDKIDTRMAGTTWKRSPPHEITTTMRRTTWNKWWPHEIIKRKRKSKQAAAEVTG